MKKIIIAVISIFFIFPLFAETTYKIDYYGVSTEVLDKNLATMTSDLYYTQLCEIQNFQITDMREKGIDISASDKSVFDDGKLSFYTVITKKEKSSKWILTIHIYNKDKDSEYTDVKEYDSYYKILMESKETLKETFISLVQGEGTVSDKQNTAITQSSQNIENKNVSASTENLAGTWQGEQNIEKIVIMRGGRGFVIFKNGATMNITVKTDNDSIIISQSGKSNASFFPELPRATALEAALSAEPIVWKLQMLSDNTLSGTKESLLPDGDKAVKGFVEVTWNRK